MSTPARSMRLLAFVGGVLLFACSGGEEVSADAAQAGEAAQSQVAPPPGGKAPASRRTTSSAPLPPGVFQMSRVQIMDPSGFEKPMLAATALVPYGWRAEGSVVWGPHGQCGVDYGAKWDVHSPDGSSLLSMRPMPQWQGVRSAYPSGQPSPCPQAFHRSVRAWLEASAQQLFPGARVLDYRALDDEVRPLRDMMAQLQQLPPVPNFESRISIEAGELLVAFNENGRDMRASLSAMATISWSRMADILNPSQVALETVNGSPWNFVIVKAPNGELDLDLRRRVLTSLRFDSEWSRRTSAFNARKQAESAATHQQIMRSNAAASAARLQASQSAHETRMQTLRETSDIMNGIYQDRQVSSDRQQRERIEAIRGVETYNDPVAGAPVQLDSSYQHAWRVNNSDNTYILTNDASFNPGAYDIDAQQLKPLQ
jgi:hypothetical protein